MNFDIICKESNEFSAGIFGLKNFCLATTDQKKKKKCVFQTKENKIEKEKQKKKDETIIACSVGFVRKGSVNN